jgi:SAM-dependent methyltransferase
MTKILELAGNLRPDSTGIWASGDRVELSYPQEGNRQCFQIEDKSFWFKHRNNCIIAALKLYPPSGPVLDVGGGNGFVTRRMLDEGFQAALLEPGPTGAFNAKTARQIPDVLCSTLEDCGFPGDSLSAVALFDVLEHIEDDRAFLAAVHACLEAGGHLYLTVPAFDWLWSLSDTSAGHYRRYHPRKLVDLLSDRFDVLFVTCFFRALTLPILALRAAPFRLGFGRRRQVLGTETEHGSSGGLAVGVVERLLSPESGQIASGRSKGWGSSCLCIARKKLSPPMITA